MSIAIHMDIYIVALYTYVCERYVKDILRFNVYLCTAWCWLQNMDSEEEPTVAT